jgi:hypothetical protein
MEVLGVMRVHARSLATQFLLQIGPGGTLEMRRETTRVSFLMCPFCVRGMLLKLTTKASVADQFTEIDVVASSGSSTTAALCRGCLLRGSLTPAVGGPRR